MTPAEHTSFKGYLRACTDQQLHGVFEKESRAERFDEMCLAVAEMERRGLEVPQEYHARLGGA